jgi:hypothetical protein
MVYQRFSRHHDVGGLGRFIISVFVAAALNFGSILIQTVRAAYGSDDEVYVCSCGPHPPFLQRLLILGALFVAAIGVSQRRFPRHRIAVAGLAGALFVYLYWWVASYRRFKNFSDAEIDFLNNVEIEQTAYLYAATSFDVWIALTIFACLVLSLDRLFNSRS